MLPINNLSVEEGGRKKLLQTSGHLDLMKEDYSGYLEVI